jgi:hypothetical protein
MKMKYLLVCVALAGILTSTNGCKKDNTATDGLSGTSGIAGTYGSTNVQSLNFNIANTNWTANAASRLWSVDYHLPFSDIVPVSLKLYMMSGNNWVKLPYLNNGITFKYEYNSSTKTIVLQAADATSKTLIANPGEMSFRVTWLQIPSKPKVQTAI